MKLTHQLLLIVLITSGCGNNHSTEGKSAATSSTDLNSNINLTPLPVTPELQARVLTCLNDEISMLRGTIQAHTDPSDGMWMSELQNELEQIPNEIAAVQAGRIELEPWDQCICYAYSCPPGLEGRGTAAFLFR